MISELGGGGAERLTVDLACGLAGGGHRVDLWVTRRIASRKDSKLEASRARDAGVRLRELNRRGKLDLPAWRPFVRYLRSARPDVLHSHTHGTNFWASLWGPMFGIPTICHEHTWAFSGDRLRLAVDRHWIGRRSDRVVAVSREDRRRMVEIEKLPAGKVTLVPNGASLPEVPPRSKRNELGAGQGDVVVLSLTRLEPQKRIDRMVEAAAEAIRSDGRLMFVVAGAGDQTAIRRSIGELGIEERFRLLGRREDRWDLLASADLFCLSSDFEGMPLAALEAAAMGIPIVSTSVGDMEAIVGSNGLLSDLDSSDLAEKIVAAASDLESFTQSAAEVRGRYRIEDTVRQVERLYEEVNRSESRQ